MKKVQGHDHLYRDDSGAIINTDVSGYQRYMARKAKLEEKDQTIATMKSELDVAKDEIKELKELVKKVLGANIDK